MDTLEEIITEFLAFCQTKDIRLAGEVFNQWLGLTQPRYMANEDIPLIIQDFLDCLDQTNTK